MVVAVEAVVLRRGDGRLAMSFDGQSCAGVRCSMMCDCHCLRSGDAVRRALQGKSFDSHVVDWVVCTVPWKIFVALLRGSTELSRLG